MDDLKTKPARFVRAFLVGLGVGLICGVIQGYALSGYEADRARQLSREYAAVASSCCASAERAVLATKRCIDQTLWATKLASVINGETDE